MTNLLAALGILAATLAILYGIERFGGSSKREAAAGTLQSLLYDGVAFSIFFGIAVLFAVFILFPALCLYFVVRVVCGTERAAVMWPANLLKAVQRIPVKRAE